MSSFVDMPLKPETATSRQTLLRRAKPFAALPRMDQPGKAAKAMKAMLFLEFNEQLLPRVNVVVRTSPQTVEDACAFACMQFLRYQPDRKGERRSWRGRTAQREAWRLHPTARAVPPAPIRPTRTAE